MVRKIKNNTLNLKSISNRVEDIDGILSSKEFEVTTGGAIHIKANAKKDVISIKLDDSLNLPDKEMLEDLILSALNQVSSKAEEITNKELSDNIKLLNL